MNHLKHEDEQAVLFLNEMILKEACLLRISNNRKPKTVMCMRKEYDTMNFGCKTNYEINLNSTSKPHD